MRKARKMVLNRNKVVTSKYGHSIAFQKDVPASVPPVMWSEVMAIGGEFADDGGQPAEAEDNSVREPTDPTERRDRILEAIEKLVEKNKCDDFTAAGQPKVTAVSDALGFKVDAKEIALAWQVRADRIAEGSED